MGNLFQQALATPLDNPLRWFGSRFAMFGVAIVGGMAIFTVAATIYYSQHPIHAVDPPLPDKVIRPAPIPDPEIKKVPESTGALISELPSNPIGRPVYVNGHQFGTVDKMIVDVDGKVRAFIILRSGPLADNAVKTFTVSPDAIRWHEVYSDNATGELNAETVRAPSTSDPR